MITTQECFAKNLDQKDKVIDELKKKLIKLKKVRNKRDAVSVGEEEEDIDDYEFGSFSGKCKTKNDTLIKEYYKKNIPTTIMIPNNRKCNFCEATLQDNERGGRAGGYLLFLGLPLRAGKYQDTPDYYNLWCKSHFAMCQNCKKKVTFSIPSLHSGGKDASYCLICCDSTIGVKGHGFCCGGKKPRGCSFSNHTEDTSKLQFKAAFNYLANHKLVAGEIESYHSIIDDDNKDANDDIYCEVKTECGIKIWFDIELDAGEHMKEKAEDETRKNLKFFKRANGSANLAIIIRVNFAGRDGSLIQTLSLMNAIINRCSKFSCSKVHQFLNGEDNVDKGTRNALFFIKYTERPKVAEQVLLTHKMIQEENLGIFENYNFKNMYIHSPTHPFVDMLPYPGATPKILFENMNITPLDINNRVTFDEIGFCNLLQDISSFLPVLKGFPTRNYGHLVKGFINA